VAVAGTGVGTADAGPSTASKPIEEIQVGDFVWARDEHDPSAPAVLQKVVALYRNTAHDLQTLDVVGELGQSVQVVATDEHPFYVVDVGWTTADAIQVGQKLVGTGGAVLTVVANRDWKPEGGVVVYNFQVEGDHTYFVGDIRAEGEWVWTHNACAAKISNVPGDDFVPNSGVVSRYARPSAAGPTAAQRASVQGKPCVECGVTTSRQIADHKTPLIVQHYRDGAINSVDQAALSAVQPHCPRCSAIQGGLLAGFSRKMRALLRLS